MEKAKSLAMKSHEAIKSLKQTRLIIYWLVYRFYFAMSHRDILCFYYQTSLIGNLKNQLMHKSRKVWEAQDGGWAGDQNQGGG